MSRADISNDLIHWIRAESDGEAYEILKRIVAENRLLGGDGHIKGEYNCVCFTEAPQNTFHSAHNRYSTFGIRISKKWAYEQGGRPVIYQHDDEFELLPESHRWRHVRYEPNREPPIDFTWEREWRIPNESLELPAGEIVIIIPHEAWADSLILDHLTSEHERIHLESIAYGDEWSYQNQHH